MEVRRDLIPAGAGVRTGYKLTRCLGLVIHWIGVCQSRAEVIRSNFGRDELGTQFVSDWNDGHIIQCVPEDEVCYHVGSSNGYTALKKKLCGSANPNWFFVGIECCIGDKSIPGDYSAPGKYMDLGKPSPEQYDGLVSFAADFLTRHGLSANDLYLHNDITGKACHIWFVKDRARWDKFKADVCAAMEGNDMTKAETEQIAREVVSAVLEAQKPKVYTSVADIPNWAQGVVQRARACGVVNGDENGKLHLTDENLANLQMLDNLGLLRKAGT